MESQQVMFGMGADSEQCKGLFSLVINLFRILFLAISLLYLLLQYQILDNIDAGRSE